MSSKRNIGLALFLGLFSLLIFQAVKAAVDLVSFTATAQEDSILIEWETATEIDNAGFYVTRATDPQPPYPDISGFIPAEGSGVIGAEYQFVDDDVTVGTEYYYILEAVDTSQNVDFHGPITVTFHTPATHTPTTTLEPTSTPSKTTKPQKTNTPTASRTPTKTRTPVPSNTYTSAPPTLTPTAFTATPTVSITPSVTPSPTLFDAPEIVVVLPSTNTPLPTVFTATPVPSLTPTPNGIFAQVIETGSLTIISAICLGILIWAAIAVGIFIYIQKRNF
jgi:hypothetical protein